jgi:hypothetical protein
MQERAYQEACFFTDDERVKGHSAPDGRPLYLRRLGREWLRQGGKTTGLARKALKQMMKTRGRLITFASASLNIGSEFVEKEAGSWNQMIADFRAEMAAQKLDLQMGENKAGDWRSLPADLDLAGLADVMERSRFEFRLYHSRTSYSRTKIIAPNIATCRSWSGTVYLDECGFVRDLQLLLQEIEPIFSTDPTFTFEWSTTPPADRAHYANKLLTAEDGRTEWDTNPAGNWYRNKVGLWVHRVTVDDAHAAGRRLYDPDSGEEQSLAANRAASLDPEGWDRSNRLKKSQTGTGALSPASLSTCQAMGMGRCLAGSIDCTQGKANALLQLEALLAEALALTGTGKLTLGHDIATTQSKTSNPSSLVMMENVGMDYPARLTVWWKTADPDLSIAILEHSVNVIRAAEKRPVSLNVDASNELYHAARIKRKLGTLVPVRLLKGGEKIERAGEATDLKTFAGNQLVAYMESARVPIANHPYLENDFGRVVKANGRFDCAVGPNGEHGDTFDGAKLALFGQITAGPLAIKAVTVGGLDVPRPGLLSPLSKLALRFRGHR